MSINYLEKCSKREVDDEMDYVSEKNDDDGDEAGRETNHGDGWLGGPGSGEPSVCTWASRAGPTTSELTSPSPTR